MANHSHENYKNAAMDLFVYFMNKREAPILAWCLLQIAKLSHNCVKWVQTEMFQVRSHIFEKYPANHGIFKRDRNIFPYVSRLAGVSPILHRLSAEDS